MPIDSKDIKAFLRMLVEVGACVWVFGTRPGEIWLAPFLLAVYHVAALGHRFLEGVAPRLTSQLYLLIAPAVALLATSIVFNWLAFAVGSLFFTGLSVSGGTRSAARVRRREVKIAAKLLGMLLAISVLIEPLVFGSLCLAASVAFTVLEIKIGQRSTTPRAIVWRRIDLVNVFHQAGYFAFCFVFWADFGALDPRLIPILFPIGWIAYWILETRLAGAGQPFRPWLLAPGHAFFSLCVLAMIPSQGMPLPLLVAWFLTGLGGGTCYTMERNPTGPPSRISDDVGAALGTVPASILVLAFGEALPTLVLSSTFALLTAILAIGVTSTQRMPTENVQ